MKSASSYPLAQLQRIAEDANRGLPVMVDGGTRLERVVAHEGVLEKQYTLMATPAATVDRAALERAARELLVCDSCGNAQSRTLYAAGVAEWYSYAAMGGEPLAAIKVDANSCGTPVLR